MPVLNSQPVAAAATSLPAAARTFPLCANPRCSSGWLHLWRKRRVPVVEGGWLCSPACTRARLGEILRRERTGAQPVFPHRHRIPIGLVLLTHGWITREDLRLALAAQRNGANMRLGEWLIANRGLDESRLVQALGLQWSCPVLSLEKHSGASVTIVPRLLSESFGFVPLRLTPAGVLYLAFEDRIDHALVLAVERITGLHVESGLLSATEFRHATRNLAQARFHRARLIEAGNLDLLAEAFTRQIEKEKPVEARIVRLHDLFWLRLWRDDSVDKPTLGRGTEDIIGSVVRFE